MLYEKINLSESFTKRELEVLKLIAQGLNNSEIAEKLNISNSTVKVYVSNMIYKNNYKNRIQLAVLAAKLGIV